MRYQRKSECVEAIQFFTGDDSAQQIKRLVEPDAMTVQLRSNGALSIEDGELCLDEGDWLVRDRLGNYTVVDDETFRDSYATADNKSTQSSAMGRERGE